MFEHRASKEPKTRAIVAGSAENGDQKPGSESNQISKEKILNSFDGNKKSGIEFEALLKTNRKKRRKQKGNRKLIESQETMYNSRLC